MGTSIVSSFGAFYKNRGFYLDCCLIVNY